MIDVHGQGAVIPDVEVHDGFVVGVRCVVLTVVDVKVEGEDRLHILLQQEAVHGGGHAGSIVRKIVRVSIGLISFRQNSVGEAALRIG